MAVLSYLGILSLVPYFAEKNNKFVAYHAKQGINLFIIEVIASVALGIIGKILFFIPYASYLLSLAFNLFLLVLSVIGIVNATEGKAKELPIVNKIKIIK